MAIDIDVSFTASKVNKTIFEDDIMYLHNHNLVHYLWCGESALRVLLASISLSGDTPPATILDFGAGAGRVTRWLTPAFPNSKIHACDVRTQDMEFLRDTLGVQAWTIGTDIDALTLPDRYDLIWAGSVVTHLREVDTRRLVAKLFSFCKPGGVLVFSFHGRRAIENGPFWYAVNDDAWGRIKAGYFDNGYGYCDYEGQTDYGISICRTTWMLDVFRDNPEARLALLSEAAWADHHDVIAVQRLPK